MNRSFRAQQMGSLRTSMMKEKDEELTLFLEMRKREKERQNLLLLNNSDEFEDTLGPNSGSSPIFNLDSATPAQKTATDEFLNSENDKNDYDWLLTPPGTPLFPSLELESQKTVTSQLGTPKPRPVALRSRLANPQQEPAPRSSIPSRQPASSPALNTSTAGLRRPSSSGGPGSRPATPTGRPTLSTSKTTLSAASKSGTTTTSRAASTTTSRTTSTITSRPSRSATPTRSTLPATKPTVPPRSSTPTARSTARSSTPTARPSIPASRSTSRAATPTRRPVTASSVTNMSAPSVKLLSSSVTMSSSSSVKSVPSTVKNPVPSRPSSPSVKPRPWKPSDMPGFSLETPPNLRTTLPDRPLSATRGRPGAPSARSSSVEPVPNGRVRRQSCSPSRGRPPNGIIHNSGGSVPAMNRLHAKANDNVSPVVVGTKMVERVINMRKLVPPKQDSKHSPHSNLSAKSSSPDSSGFGRSLSKKSLDMAIRHMDIRRSIPGNLRPLMTNIPASSMYSVRSGHTRSRTVSVSDSPLATSSNASSELSVNNNAFFADGSEIDDDASSDKGPRSPASVRGR